MTSLALGALLGALLALCAGLIWRWSSARPQFGSTAREQIRLKHALWGSGDELWDWDVESGEIHRHNTLPMVCGDNRASERIEDSLARIHPDDVCQVRDNLDAHLEGETPYFEAHYRMRSKDGPWIWILDRAKVVEYSGEGKPVRLTGTLRNISAIKNTEDQLKLIATAFQNTSDGVVIADHQGYILAVNQAFTEITGYDADEVIGEQYIFRGGPGRPSEQEEDAIWDRVMESLMTTGQWRGEISERTKGNPLRKPLSVRVNAVMDDNDVASHYIGVFSDITFRKQTEENLKRLANHDTLTGLPNRSLFNDRLSKALARARRRSSLVALLFMDLDRFKNVNDSLGHAMGDLLLKEVSRRLQTCLREEDTIARLGGDEFTIVLEGIHKPKDVIPVAKKIGKAVGAVYDLDGYEANVTPSVGISIYPNDGEDADTLVKNADTAMYHAKRQGRNNHQFFDRMMNAEVTERLDLENKMRLAMQNREFAVYYQPKVDLRSGRIAGAEALMRWYHEEHGWISPLKFIAIAEETGLIRPLGEWVLEQSCRQAANWLAAGYENCHVSVNLSPRQFQSATLVERVSDVLSTTGLPPAYLELEITETTLVDNLDHTADSLNRLRDLGVRLSLDDFGTGYSSLTYLKRFPLHRLKIDQSFVRDVMEDADDARIVSAIVSLAHNLGISVVAEGVESEEQLQFLRDLDCDEVQGYLMSPPVDSDKMTALLQEESLQAAQGDSNSPSVFSQVLQRTAVTAPAASTARLPHGD
ncbi:MAG: EAL domain-containing protein [Xanthomonadales bacterium]|nr:EAL domain-containing protein [Xanthomonadales bacterium]